MLRPRCIHEERQLLSAVRGHETVLLQVIALVGNLPLLGDLFLALTYLKIHSATVHFAASLLFQFFGNLEDAWRN